jgi:toxin ParE1/3/4
MKITFDPRARDDLDRIFAWIAKDNPKAARDMMARIEARIRLLAVSGFGQMGRRGLLKGTRELVEPPYIIVYELRESAGEIVVLAIMHGAQDRRPT